MNANASIIVRHGVFNKVAILCLIGFGFGFASIAKADAVGGMVLWTGGSSWEMLDLTQKGYWYDVPRISKQTFNVASSSVWRVHADVRCRFIPLRAGDYGSVRIRLLVDNRVLNVVGSVLDLSAGGAIDEFNHHQDIEALVSLTAGQHTIRVQALKWEAAPSSHIDLFADMNGYSSLIWEKVGP